jgi:hypothetical protein
MSNFLYNSIGIAQNNFSDGDTIRNCIVEYGNIGLNGLLAAKVENCVVRHNNWGIIGDNGTTTRNTIIDSNKYSGYKPGGSDSILYCKIQYNKIGIDDSLYIGQNIIQKNTIDNNAWGVIFRYSNDQLSCNSICNNTFYNLYYSGTNNISIANNYWCTADSAATQATIYDGYNNINYGLAFFTPTDSSCSPTIITSINTVTKSQNTITIYPNPSKGIFTITTPDISNELLVEIYDMLGEKIYSTPLSTTNTTLSLSNAVSGVYFYRVLTGSGSFVSAGKFLIEK